MSIRFTDIFNKKDIIKIGILLIVSIICLTWVWREYQKPILPPDLELEVDKQN